MRGVYIGNGRVLVSTTWGGKLLVSSTDLSLAPDLIINGVYDVPLTNYLIKNIKAGDTVFDVGANLGCFTVLLGHLVGPNGRVLAYEANPATCSLLQDNVSMSYLNKQTEIFNKAVYKETATLSFYQTEKFHGNASIYKHDDSYFDYFGSEQINEVKIAAEPLDIHAAKFACIKLIKIDIEGAEYDAFLGMKKLLTHRVVDTVVFELNKTRLGDRWFSFYNLLAAYQADYFAKFFTISNEGVPVPAELDALFARGEIPAVLMNFSHAEQVKQLLSLCDTCLEALNYIAEQLSKANYSGAGSIIGDFVAATDQIERTLSAMAGVSLPDTAVLTGFKEKIQTITSACNKNNLADALEILQTRLLPEYQDWKCEIEAVFNPWEHDLRGCQ